MFKSYRERGILLVISGPSGVGKGTVIDGLLKQTDSLQESISVTTRAPRPGEVEGVHYYFRDRDTFLKMVAQNEILEYDEYCDNFYGTPKQNIMDHLAAGEDVVMDITVPGALRTMEMIPETVSIFLFPPSMKELEARLTGRGTESPEVVEKRLEQARREIHKAKYFDYLMVNDDLERSWDTLSAILTAERHKRERLTALEDFVNNL